MILLQYVNSITLHKRRKVINQPYKVHTYQFFHVVAGVTKCSPNCGITDAHPVFVGAHLRPPRPGGFTEDHSVGVTHLADLLERALQWENNNNHLQNETKH